MTDAPHGVGTKISTTYTLGPSPDEEEFAIAAARKGDMAPAQQLRQKIRNGHNEIINALARPELKAGEHIVLREFLVDGQSREADFNASIRAARDDLRAHRMEELAEASNTIAAASATTAKALKRWTVVLAAATVALALATVALVVVTLRLD